MALTDVDNFYDNLLNIKDNFLFKEYCLIEKQNIENSYRVITTLKSIYSKYIKKSLNFNFNKEKSLIIRNVFRLEKEDYKILNDEYKSKVSKNISKRKWIYSVDEYINTSISLIESNKINDNIVGLAALTGRRVAEIGCSAFFKYVNDNEVLFSGQLKTKTRDDIIPYNIPVLYNAKTLINVLNRIRYEKPQFINNPVLFHNTCSKAISGIAKKAFVNVVEDETTPKDLRAIYACLAQELFNDGSVAITRYIANLLGHGEKDNETCNSYMNYRID
jgi:integrase